MNHEISPLRALEKALHLWWLIAALGILGGLLGWVFTRITPPVYEASALFSISLRETELAPTDQLSMTYTQQENYLGPIEALLTSPTMQAQLAISAKENGIEFNPENFSAPNFRIERVNDRWRLIVRSSDPRMASALANLWADVVQSTLIETNRHAVKAEQLRLESNIIRQCFEANDIAQANICAGTSFLSVTEMEARLADLDIEYTDEHNASLGVTFALEFSLVEKSEVPDRPVLYNQGMLLFASVAIGLLLGFILCVSLPARMVKRSETD